VKAFTPRRAKARDFLQAEDINANGRAIGNTYNGNLSGEQLPYEAFTEAVFTAGDVYDSTYKTTVAGAATGTAQRKPSQTYATTQSAITTFNTVPSGLSSPILGPPAKTYTLSTDVQPGWNALKDHLSTGVYLSGPVLQGMIKGVAMVDFEFYQGDKSAYGLASGLSGASWRHRLGVFVDGVLIASTGTYSPRRHTHCIPFAIPVSTRTIEVDIRFIVKYDGPGVVEDYIITSDDVLNIYNTSLYLRNVYR
jgi:hypothetical protein